MINKAKYMILILSVVWSFNVFAQSNGLEELKQKITNSLEEIDLENYSSVSEFTNIERYTANEFADKLAVILPIEKTERVHKTTYRDEDAFIKISNERAILKYINRASFNEEILNKSRIVTKEKIHRKVLELLELFNIPESQIEHFEINRLIGIGMEYGSKDTDRTDLLVYKVYIHRNVNGIRIDNSDIKINFTPQGELQYINIKHWYNFQMLPENLERHSKEELKSEIINSMSVYKRNGIIDYSDAEVSLRLVYLEKKMGEKVYYVPAIRVNSKINGYVLDTSYIYTLKG